MADKRLLAPGPNKGREDVSTWTWAGRVDGAERCFEVLECPADRRYCAVVGTRLKGNGEPDTAAGQKIVATTEKGYKDAFKWAFLLVDQELEGK
jgi:hypothetical protein